MSIGRQASQNTGSWQVFAPARTRHRPELLRSVERLMRRVGMSEGSPVRPLGAEAEAVALSGPTKPINRPLEPDELTHITEGDYKLQGAFDGGGHLAENRTTLVNRGFREIPDHELPSVLATRAKEGPYREALHKWETAQATFNRWRNELTEEQGKADLRKLQGPLKNPNLVGAARQAQELLVEAAKQQVAQWEQNNPRPPLPGPKPLPENHGLAAGHQLDTSRYFYHQPLGNTGARIGGITPSSNPIHYDGHTWFPPKWDGPGILHVLSSSDPRIVVQTNTENTMTRYTAWIRRNIDGTYEIAPAGIGDPVAAGYLKSTLLVTHASDQRTLYPEMNQ
ncbi:MAG TPA: hypothetical protein PLA94_25210 [Myxococcota bacterium]|nr:hypothetical protein [Myxococcota bacterium]